MPSPKLLSMAELPDGNVVADGEPTVHKGLAGLKSAFKPRAYQLEMLEDSMRRNIIVALRLSCFPFYSAANTLQMDTGSGKTGVYVYKRLEWSFADPTLERSCVYKQN